MNNLKAVFISNHKDLAAETSPTVSQFTFDSTRIRGEIGQNVVEGKQVEGLKRRVLNHTTMEQTYLISPNFAYILWKGNLHCYKGWKWKNQPAKS